MAKIGAKWNQHEVGMGENGAKKIGQNGATWGETDQNGSKWVKIHQNRVKMAQTGTKESQHGPQWVKIGSKCGQNGLRSPKMQGGTGQSGPKGGPLAIKMC